MSLRNHAPLQPLAPSPLPPPSPTTKNWNSQNLPWGTQIQSNLIVVVVASYSSSFQISSFDFKSAISPCLAEAISNDVLFSKWPINILQKHQQRINILKYFYNHYVTNQPIFCIIIQFCRTTSKNSAELFRTLGGTFPHN